MQNTETLWVSSSKSVCFTFILTLIVPHVNSCTMAVNYQSSLLEFESKDFFCDITIMCLSCRSSWRRCRRCSSRESSRERKISSSWERLWRLIRWVWRRREVCLSLSSFSLKPESLCPNSALHRQQWRTVRGSLLSSSAPLREAVLSWYGWPEIRKS